MNAMPGEALLAINDLRIQFGGLVAVNDFSMELREGRIAGIIGPNGAGKTTVFNAVTGVYKPTAGEIRFQTDLISGKAPYEITRKGIARTFQNIRLFKGLNVLSNVMAAAGFRAQYGFLGGLLGMPGVWRQERGIEAEARLCLNLVDLQDYQYLMPENLPYGLQRKLEIARALATKPRLILLDEPAAGLNPNEVNELMDLIRKIHHELGVTVLLIEHHMEMVMGICEELWVLNFGKMIAHGTPAEIQCNEEVLKAYLGD